jgi:two-component system sensor histidine kinase DegS
MNLPIKSLRNLAKQAKVAASNPHFWIIIALILSLTYLYHIPFADLGIGPPGIWRFRMFEFVLGLTGSLFYLPIIYSAIIFGWSGIIITWIISIAILMPTVTYYDYNPVILVTNIMFLTIPIIVGLMIIFFLKWLRRERRLLIEREADRQEYMSQVWKAQENERKRLSQELHDDTIQTLLAIGNGMQYITRKERDKLTPEFSKQIESYNDSIFQVTEDLRRISIDLRPSILDNIGLLEAVRWLADDLYEKGVNVKFRTNGMIRKLPSGSDVHVFRFVQEALNNVRKHAEASETLVEMDFNPESIRIAVQDNGKGFIMPENTSAFYINGKLGIMGMQDRANLINGRFNIYSQPGKGTTASILINTG